MRVHYISHQIFSYFLSESWTLKKSPLFFKQENNYIGMEIRYNAFLATAIAITVLNNKYRTKTITTEQQQPTVVENLDDVVISGDIRLRIPQKLDVPRHRDSKTSIFREEKVTTSSYCGILTIIPPDIAICSSTAKTFK